MRSGLIWALGVATWFVVSVGAAQSDGEDAAPWHVAKIAKLNRTRPQLEQLRRQPTRSPSISTFN